jgi:predicted MFS family arabinose efflux permease
VGNLIGWRNVFLCTAGLGMLALAFQAATLPSMSNNEPASMKTIFQVLKRPGIPLGMLAIMLIFAGDGIFFIYAHS